jgi:hypothetical protein
MVDASRSSDNMIVTLVCALVVVLFAAHRYDTPETNRLSTTRTLFHLTRAGYVAASVALFFALSEVVLKPGVLPILGLDAIKSAVARYSAPPVLAAVLLTAFLPNTAVVNAGDAWLLKYFQSLGRIPQGVRNLADSLMPSALRLGEADIEDLRTWILSAGEAPKEFTKNLSVDLFETSRGGLTRTLKLYFELQKLEDSPAYAALLRSRHDAWQAMQADFRVFIAQSQAFFVLFEELNRMEGPAGENELNKARKSYREICLTMHKRIAEFLAQLLVIVEGSDLRIGNRLRSIGFSAPDPYPPMQVGPFLFLGVTMIFAILGIVSIMPTRGGGPLPLSVTAILIGTTRTIALLAAVLPKLRWSTYRPDSRGNLPFTAWLVWAAVAAVISLLIERTALGIAHQAISTELDFQDYPLSPMAPMAFASSLSISILCDIDLGLGRGWARRVTEGLLCGLAMVFSIFVCTHLLALPASTSTQVSPWFPPVFAFSLAFLSGLFGPYLYRRALEEEPAGSPAALHA